MLILLILVICADKKLIKFIELIFSCVVSLHLFFGEHQAHKVLHQAHEGGVIKFPETVFKKPCGDE